MDIPTLNIFMTKKRIKSFPIYEFKEGYEAFLFDPHEHNSAEIASNWIRLVMENGSFESFAEALTYFNNVFVNREQPLGQQVHFVKNAEGMIVATCSIVMSNHFGVPLPRLSFLAVQSVFKGMGLGKALLTTSLQSYCDSGANNGIYILTNTEYYAQVNLFLEFGFEPYMKVRPAGYNTTNEQYDKNKFIAWEQLGARLNLEFDYEALSQPPQPVAPPPPPPTDDY